MELLKVELLLELLPKIKIPVKFIGVGEGVDDMEKFNAEDFVSAII